MEFSYRNSQDEDINYCRKFDSYLTLDRSKYDEQDEVSLRHNNRVDFTLQELKKRSSPDYYEKVNAVQVLAKDYARKVFPTYKFIQPDAIVDDWLSTVDFHREKKTRDHSLHQTLTAYIVSKMLGQGDMTQGLLLPNGNTLLSQCAEQLLQEPRMEYLREYIRKEDPNFIPFQNGYDLSWAADVFYEAAFISALFHDMGYPWQYVNGLSKSLKGANYDEINGALLNVEEAAKKMNDSLLIYPLYGYQGAAVLNPSPDQHRDALEMIKQGLLNKHGLPGAIGFMWLNQKIRYKPNKDLRNEASFKLITDWAAVGIMMHDMPGVYRKDDGTINFGVLRIDCKKDPLSCIISLADILEEFERPKTDFDWYEDKEKNVKHVALSYDFFCIGTIVELVGGKMKVTYLYATDEEAEKMLDGRQKEVWEYLNPKDGYLDLSAWGIADGEGFTMKV
jgi:hypothetical protein